MRKTELLFPVRSATTTGERARHRAIFPSWQHFMGDPLDNHSNSSDRAGDPLSSSLNVRIGNYTLLRCIGDGGMGAVYEAEQDNPRRRVAVKVLRNGLLSESARRNFLSEARHLGQLQHPNIAQIYEASIHDEGPISLPFYAMELVQDAKPISSYVNEKGLSTAQRVELFLTLCDAVDHAHAQGILHCDLKPANILVDSSGTIKVIDFGIARAADTQQPGRTMQSATGVFQGTPQYMSPEQFSSHDGVVTAKSDIYSLGVVLYELLCGKLPYVIDRNNTLQTIRTVTELEPFAPREANSSLSKNVEAVLLKCLSKRRSDRYETVRDLRDDLTRLLAGAPVFARKRNRVLHAAARLRHWIGRNRLRVGLVALPALWLVCFFALPAMDSRWFCNRFQSLAVTRFKHFPDMPLADVRIIAITNIVPNSIARALSIRGFDPNAPKSERALHGALMSKLAAAQCGARIVVWDLYFPGGAGSDNAFADGVRALKRVGIPVVVGAFWSNPMESGPKPPSSIIAESGAAFGGISGNLSLRSPWLFDVAWQRGHQPAQPSVALLAAEFSWFPGSIPPLVEPDIEGVTLRAAANGQASSASSRRISVSGLAMVTPQEAVRVPGLADGDATATYAVEVPGADSLRTNTFDYAQVASASDADLRRWFSGKVIMIGDARLGRDGPFGYPDGRVLPGFVGQAVSVQRLLDQQPIRCVELVHVFGARVTLSVLIAISAATAGTLLGFALATRIFLRFSLELLVVFGLVAGSLASYRLSARLISPAVGAAVFIMSSELLALIRRTKLKPIGAT